MTEYRGSCHCGALSYRYLTALPPEQWSVRACQCSFCRAHAAVTTSDPRGSLMFEATASERVQRYRFGAGTADFLICRQCGIYLGATCEFQGARFGLPNLNAMRPLPDRTAAATPMVYEGESRSERLARRASRWTPLLAGSL
jgi:hypothetical protein